jgi:hypothetical protein
MKRTDFIWCYGCFYIGLGAFLVALPIAPITRFAIVSILGTFFLLSAVFSKGNYYE